MAARMTVKDEETANHPFWIAVHQIAALDVAIRACGDAGGPAIPAIATLTAIRAKIMGNLYR